MKLFAYYLFNYQLHNTEAALVKVTNDLLTASGSLSLLILFDLSSAFDTIDHALLLNHLESIFGLSETVIDRFRSYFTDHRQFVYMGGFTSKVDTINTGVPQGSVLGPLLFSIFSTE